MTTELIFQIVVRGNVTPDQWRALIAGDRDAVRALEDVFRDRLTAHAVTIQEVSRATRSHVAGDRRP